MQFPNMLSLLKPRSIDSVTRPFAHAKTEGMMLKRTRLHKVRRVLLQNDSASCLGVS